MRIREAWTCGGLGLDRRQSVNVVADAAFQGSREKEWRGTPSALDDDSRALLTSDIIVDNCFNRQPGSDQLRRTPTTARHTGSRDLYLHVESACSARFVRDGSSMRQSACRLIIYFRREARKSSWLTPTQVGKTWTSTSSHHDLNRAGDGLISSIPRGRRYALLQGCCRRLTQREDTLSRLRRHAEEGGCG
jgi:hypothetical protein